MDVHAIVGLKLSRALALNVVLILFLIVPVSADLPGGICPTQRFSVGATYWYIFGMMRGMDNTIRFIKPVTSNSYHIASIALNEPLTEFPIDGTPVRLAIASDYNIWYTRSDSGVISRLTLSGTITSFPIPGIRSDGITPGADANLWITDSAGNQIERITTAGSVTGQFTIPTADSGLGDIVLGADSNLWFIESAAKKIGRISSAGLVAEFLTLTPSADLTHITPGPDGNIWFTETVSCTAYCSYSYYNRITPDGTITRFGPTAPIGGITAGSDGNLWAILRLRYNFLIGRIAVDGSLTTFGSPSREPYLAHLGNDIVAGGDGRIWIGTGSYDAQSIEIFDSSKLGCFYYFPWVAR